MISFEAAKAAIAQHIVSLGEEPVDIDNALGRVLAEKVLADRDYPPFNRAAMDGYALRFQDWSAGIRQYQVVETILAGQPVSKEITTGSCYKIMTGAAVPFSADMVIRVEDSAVQGDQVTLKVDEPRPYLNIARQGEDFSAGQLMIGGAVRLSPQLISVLAALGREQVKVKRLPSVAVLTTGNEVVPLGQEVLPYQIRNSNTYLIRSMLRAIGVVPAFVAHAPDDQALLRQALDQALKHELVIINGGVSAGDADYIPQLLEEFQVRKIFHKVAIRPGKPIWVGEKPNGGLVFALPGNPFSCMVTFHLFVKLFLDLSQDLKISAMPRLPFSGEREKKVNLDEFFPVRIDTETMSLHQVAINGSGDIRLGLHANAIAMHPLNQAKINHGDLVNFFVL